MTGSNGTGATCGQPVRGGGICLLSPGHRGYHSTVVYTCDACGKRRRGQPHQHGRDGEYQDGLAFCFMCVGIDPDPYGLGPVAP